MSWAKKKKRGVTIEFPPVLRPSADGERKVVVEGETVGDVLAAVVAKYPHTKGQIFDAAGQINRYVNIYVGQEEVRVLQGLDTPVEDGDRIVLLPASAGGR